ncbi:MAG: transposase [bacterium]
MPRPPRKQYSGALYHVTSRGNGRGRIFFDDSDRDRFLNQLQDCLETYGVVLYAYVLMSNHYHLLVRTAHPNLSRFMQRLNTSYALYSRYKHRKPGHQLEGRYKAKLVQGDEYLMTMTRYIHLNPVKVKALRNQGKAELKRYLEAYRWSSYGGYRDKRRGVEFVCYDVLKTLESDPQKARQRYRAYVQGCLMEDDSELRRLLDQSSHGIGDEEYVSGLEEELRERKSGAARDRDVAYPDEGIALGRIDELVAREYGTGIEALKAHGRRNKTGTAKLAAIELACRLSGKTQREIGECYGGVCSQAISAARKRAKELVPPETLARLAALVRKQAHVSN